MLRLRQPCSAGSKMIWATRPSAKAEERKERRGGARPCRAVLSRRSKRRRKLAKADPDEPFSRHSTINSQPSISAPARPAARGEAFYAAILHPQSSILDSVAFSANSVRSCSRSVLVFGLFGLKSLRSLCSSAYISFRRDKLRLKFRQGNGESLLFDSRAAPAQNLPPPHQPREAEGLLRGQPREAEGLLRGQPREAESLLHGQPREAKGLLRGRG